MCVGSHSSEDAHWCIFVCVCVRLKCLCVYLQLESRCQTEMEEHKQRLDREFECLLVAQGREYDNLGQRHAKERERHAKNALAIESRCRRQIQQQQESDMKQFLAQQKKDYTRMKEDTRKVIRFDSIFC
jgi:hypothetical protein